MKKIIFTPAARADVRRIDRDTAMRILTALDRFARTGEGDIKKLEGNTNDLRLRVGDYRVRFIEKRSIISEDWRPRDSRYFSASGDCFNDSL